MQKLYVESLLPVEPRAAWALFESQAFRDRLAAETGIHSQLESTETRGPVQVQRLKFVGGTDLPTIAAKALGTKRLTYDQENRLDLSRSALDWEVFLPMLGERVTVKGITSIFEHPDGCRRVVDGTIEVRMRLVGGQIEKAVVGEFGKSMNRAVELVRQMITEEVEVPELTD